jgi:hypothetical protein
MDKKTEKLLKEYNISEESLNNNHISLQIDLSGRRSKIMSIAKRHDVTIKEVEEDNMDGKEVIYMTGSIGTILQMVGDLEAHFGSYLTIGIAMTAGAAIAYYSIPEVRKSILERIKSLSKK